MPSLDPDIVPRRPPASRRHPGRTIALIAALLLSIVGGVASTSNAAAATPKYVQGRAKDIRSGNVNRASLPAAVTRGNLIVVYAVWDNRGGVMVGDNRGDVFAPATPRRDWGPGWSAQVFYAKKVAGGSTTVTTTFANAITQFGLVYIHEYSGVDPTNPFDGSAASAGTGSAMTSGPVTTTNPTDLLFGAGASKDTVTAAGSGWTTRSTAFANRTQDRNVTSTGTYAATATQNSDAWVMQVVAFKAAGSASAGTVQSTTTTAAPTTTTAQPTTTTTMPMSTTTTMPMSTTTTMPMSTTTTTMAPMPGMSDHCHLPQVAYCDTFDMKMPGGRGGDLDETKWSFARLSQEVNPSQGLVNRWVPAVAEFCTTTKTVVAPNDSFICGQEFGEPNHWMEAFDDNGSYVMNSNRIRQPFDFAGRTGNMVFDVDAKTTGPHGSWIEVFLTEDPMDAAHSDKPGTHLYPRNGIGFTFDADWCGDINSQKANALRSIEVFNNYVLTGHTVRSQCFTTKGDSPNHFQIKVSSNHIEVWASDAGGVNFRQIASVDVPTLPFTRGYWSFQHAQYNAQKQGAPSAMTYHWHAIGFDGPVLPMNRGYDVPDALEPAGGGAVNLGYVVPTTTFSLNNVDLTNVKAAYLNYSVWYASNAKNLTVTINGVARTIADQNPDASSESGDKWRYTSTQIPLSALKSGTNTLKFSTGSCYGNCPTVANISLELVPNG